MPLSTAYKASTPTYIRVLHKAVCTLVVAYPVVLQSHSRANNIWLKLGGLLITSAPSLVAGAASHGSHPVPPTNSRRAHSICGLQVEWSQPPQPVGEFFSNFSNPQTQHKLQARLKCNIYYYRANYAIILLAGLAIALVRNLSATLAIMLCILGILCLNDTFASSLR